MEEAGEAGGIALEGVGEGAECTCEQAYQTHEVLGAALSPAFYLVARDVAD